MNRIIKLFKGRWIWKMFTTPHANLKKEKISSEWNDIDPILKLLVDSPLIKWLILYFKIMSMGVYEANPETKRNKSLN